MPIPAYDLPASRRLAERTQYEAWFLEAVYAVVEHELFPSFPDGVIYPLDGTGPKFIHYGRGDLRVGDWRQGFLNAGAPLVFVATFKLLDMFIEWVLEENGYSATFRFQDKIRRLAEAVTFPAAVEARPWLRERICGMYGTLEPLRGTIIHERHFTSSDGALRVAPSKGGVTAPPITIDRNMLRELAVVLISVLRYVDGNWSLSEYREKVLRHVLDEIASLHNCPPLGQRAPYFTNVRVYVDDLAPSTIDVDKVKSDLERRFSDRDCFFAMRVLVVSEGRVTDAFCFPADALNEWKREVDPTPYRSAIPQDVDLAHCQLG